MSKMTIDFGEFNSLTSTAQNLSNKFSKRISDFEGIQKNIDGIGSRRNNLDEASYFIKKKTQQYKEKKEKIDNFCNRIAEFKTEAQNADKRVARRIETDTKTFRKANDINISVIASIGVALKESLPWNQNAITRYGASLIENWGTDVRKTIKDWYLDGGGKYIAHIAFDAVLLVAAAIAVIVTLPEIAVAATASAIIFAVIGLIAAVKGAYDVFANLKYDVDASSNFQKTKNRASSDKIDSKGGRDLTEDGASKIASKIPGEKDDKLLKNAALILYDVVGIIAIVKDIKGVKDFALKGITKIKSSNVTASKVVNAVKNIKTSDVKTAASKVSMDIKNTATNTLNKVNTSLVDATSSFKGAIKFAGDTIAFVGESNDAYKKFNFDLEKDKLKPSTYIKETVETIKNTYDDISNCFGGNKKAIRISKMTYDSNFKMPVKINSSNLVIA